MKKIVMIASVILLSSCGNGSSKGNGNLDSLFSDDVPKCGDSVVSNYVISILKQNKGAFKIEAFGEEFPLYQYSSKYLDENIGLKLDNIMTLSEDEDLKSCGCEGVVKMTTPNDTSKSLVSSVSYEAQKNPQGEVIVKVSNLSAFKVKHSKNE